MKSSIWKYIIAAVLALVTLELMNVLEKNAYDKGYEAAKNYYFSDSSCKYHHK